MKIYFFSPTGRNCQEETEKLPGFKIEAPAEVRVQRGLCVRIPCNFTVGPSYTLTRDAIGIWYTCVSGRVAASTDSSRFPDTTNGRFIFTGKVSAGDCSFSISDAQPGDTDQYEFRLEDRDPLRFSYVGIQPSVSVINLKIPDIYPTKTLMADEEMTLTCTVLANCPGLSPTFTWEGSVNTERTQAHQLQHQDGKLSYRSNITFTPSPRDHNTSLTCIVTNKHGSANASITLKVDCESSAYY
uniref:Ig-like domain-containing protein n=1 Tax=Xenopus tropicalis TaxID=8364 RepID=A0A6I8Q7E1_XENTR